MTGARTPAGETSIPRFGRVTPRVAVAWSLVVAAVGLSLLIVGLFVDRDRALFSYLDAWTFGTTVSLGALLLLMTGHAAKSDWMVVTRRPTEAIVCTLPLFVALFVPIVLGLAHVYPWAMADAARPPALARAIAHTQHYLNPPFFILRTVLYFAIFASVGLLLRSWSTANDRAPDARLVQRMRRLSAGALPPVAIALTWASFDWTMSLEPDWYSTIFGLYYFAGSFLAAVALVAVILPVAHDRRGPISFFTPDHAQAVGRVLFAMVIFWAYMAFSQLLIYWIGDLPVEISYYRLRTTGSWSAVTALLVFGHFFFPFFALLSRRMKRQAGYLGWMAAWLFVMHFVDVYWMIMPVHDPAGVRPHWLDLAAAMFIGGLSSASIVRSYARVSPLPAHVPELADGLDYEAAL